MVININDKITLSNDKKYIVISKIVYENNTYYYLLDDTTHKDIKICFENLKNQSLIEIKNRELIQKLFPLFIKSSQENIAKMLIDMND